MIVSGYEISLHRSINYARMQPQEPTNSPQTSYVQFTPSSSRKTYAIGQRDRKSLPENQIQFSSIVPRHPRWLIRAILHHDVKRNKIPLSLQLVWPLWPPRESTTQSGPSCPVASSSSSCRHPESKPKKKLLIRHAFRKRDHNHFHRQTLPARLRTATQGISSARFAGGLWFVCVCMYVGWEAKIVKILTRRNATSKSLCATAEPRIWQCKLSLYFSLAEPPPHGRVSPFVAVMVATEVGSRSQQRPVAPCESSVFI